MPSFVYRAADTTGRVIRGVLDGESEADVMRALEQQSLTPLKLRREKSKKSLAADGSGSSSRSRLSLHELLEFTRQLKVMLASGTPLLSTLGLLRKRSHGHYAHLLDRLAADIQSGATLSEALAAHPRTFDSFYIGTIRAGEAAGVHTEALTELIAYYERRAGLKRKIIGALTYPAIVVVTLIGALIVMLIVVVPQFKTVFDNAGAELPLPTRVLLSMSDFVTGHGFALVIGVVVFSLAFGLALRVTAVRLFVGRAASHLPFAGPIFHLSTVIQFTRMIALLERAGLQLMETLKTVQNMLMPGPVKDLTGEIRRKVAAGGTMSEAVDGSTALPDLVQHMIAVGESSGNIDETMNAAAAHFEELIDVKIGRLTTALEPLLTLVVSALVLGVALAIFLPMWEMNNVILEH